MAQQKNAYLQFTVQMLHIFTVWALFFQFQWTLYISRCIAHHIMLGSMFQYQTRSQKEKKTHNRASHQLTRIFWTKQRNNYSTRHKQFKYIQNKHRNHKSVNTQKESARKHVSVSYSFLFVSGISTLIFNADECNLICKLSAQNPK